MSQSRTDRQSVDASLAPESARFELMLSAFRDRLRGSTPFREDGVLLADLLGEVQPVLESLARGYEATAGGLDVRAQTALHEGFALFSLLCRRAALLGATPTASLALARAISSALEAVALSLTSAQREELAMVAVEGYSAGRDELRERELRTLAAESQVWFALAPRCYGVFLGGSHLSEQLERVLDDVARKLFRAEARSVLLDVSRLRDAHEDTARVLVAFATTLLGLGTQVLVHGSAPSLSEWFERLSLSQRGAQQCADFAEAVARTLGCAGYELRARGRLGDLMDKVRSGPR